MHELVFIIFFQFSKSLTSSSSTSSINSISISTSFSSSSFSNRSTSSQALPISNCSPANSYIDSSDTDSALSNANYPSPQPSTSFSSPPPPSNKRRRTSLPTGSTKTSPAVLKKMHKSTQTAAIVTGLLKQCNVCLSEEEKGYWVGCDHKSKKCQYWVHDRCLRFSFKNKAELKKVTYKCPKILVYGISE